MIFLEASAQDNINIDETFKKLVAGKGEDSDRLSVYYCQSITVSLLLSVYYCHHVPYLSFS